MKKCTIFAILMVFLLTACGQKEPETYSQATLPAPDRVTVNSVNSNITYEPGSENYEKLYEALRANWWLTGEDGSDLKAVTSLEALKTTSDDTLRHTAGDIVFFLYEENPIAWDVTAEEQISIALIGFVIPEVEQASELPVKGHFLAAQTQDWGLHNEGLYTYFYPPELANDLWSFLKTVS